MAKSSKRRLADTDAFAVGSYHPTKGHRRTSLKRIVAQYRISRMIRTWSLLGAAAR